jgi:hypothetical protein
MRKIVAIALGMMALMLSNCGYRTGKNTINSGMQLSDSTSGKLVFREYEHDFGKVTEGEKVGYVFTFENQGKGNLVILSATTSCGCTIPKYDIKPIAPGESGNIEVIFDTSGRNGMQTKTITVKSNATTPVILLKITADVTGTINNQ